MYPRANASLKKLQESHRSTNVIIAIGKRNPIRKKSKISAKINVSLPPSFLSHTALSQDFSVFGERFAPRLSKRDRNVRFFRYACVSGSDAIGRDCLRCFGIEGCNDLGTCDREELENQRPALRSDPNWPATKFKKIDHAASDLIL